MSFLLDIVFGGLLGFLAELFWWLVPDEIQRRNDRKRFLEGEVRCGIRAVKGRVLNIGTEWSAGVAQISPGMLHFTPAIGIVGTREVRVLSIRERDDSIGPSKHEYSVGEWLDFVVTTAAGELVVRFPLEVGDAAAEVLSPSSSATDAPPRLFVYGTLAPGRSNEHVLADLNATWTPAQVRGHLVAQGWGAALGHPGLTPDESAPWVDGLLFESAELPDHWSRLDDFEGPGYERVLVSAQLADGSAVSTFAYAIRPAHD